jgi:REP element-mobilizing transposase RayT
MPRALRIEYPGAIYHVLNRGDRREPIFRDALDQQRFLATLAEACTKTDWQVHAYVLMHNHFHLVVETPNANLVAGIRWFLSTYTAGSRFDVSTLPTVATPTITPAGGMFTNPDESSPLYTGPFNVGLSRGSRPRLPPRLQRERHRFRGVMLGSPACWRLLRERPCVCRHNGRPIHFALRCHLLTLVAWL